MRDELLSVVIPAYNEEARIGPSLEKIHNYLKDKFVRFEIIVVDDGSTDGTSGVVDNASLHSVRLLRNDRNSGKGFSIRKGILSSVGDLILPCDADLSTPIEEVEKLLPYLHEGYEIIIGSRGLAESEIALRQPWYREGMGKTFNLFVRLLLFGGISDTQCGFKLFKGDAAKKLFRLSRIDGFSFDAEVLFIAKNSGYKIKEVPIKWVNSPASKVQIIKDPLRMFIDLFRIRAFNLSGYYKP